MTSTPPPARPAASAPLPRRALIVARTAPSRRALLAAALVSPLCVAAAASAPASAATPDPSADPSADPALDQTVTSDEQAVHGEPADLSVGHVDIGPRIVDGQWVLAARDDHASPPVWRDLADAVLVVPDAAQLPVPDGEEYAFLGAQAGEKVWTIPQTEIPGVVWLGWNTQDPAVVQEAPDGITLRFTGIQGPGRLTLFLQPGNFAPPQLLVDGEKLAGGAAQDVFVETNTHTHANWVFTKPGAYTVGVEVLPGRPDSGADPVAAGVLRFAVGDATAPQTAREAAAPEGAAGAAGGSTGADGSAASNGSSAGPAAGGSESDGSASLPWMIGGGLGGTALLGAGAAAVVAKRRRAAEQAAFAGADTPGEAQ
ncbi:choice-of-anchor M domain-containing protein [Helcobacillus massiliensis]|uniref:choice-of-anchor M domain-containing protein n=1 Tax=Helcobacillus massiliensis TaxID=521392 RepID=UPI0021A74C75|nr:choice-of-anchor M domain-containing protein [Helcobacillus massiliensis]MCT1558102.1 choice-of-anchor M domain-containing protein [Helcobacillus massiliensis]MCT2332527.1 choice-of-anchor M domain-containing protein [Helcobacillus massiliensis]